MKTHLILIVSGLLALSASAFADENPHMGADARGHDRYLSHGRGGFALGVCVGQTLASQGIVHPRAGARSALFANGRYDRSRCDGCRRTDLPCRIQRFDAERNTVWGSVSCSVPGSVRGGSSRREHELKNEFEPTAWHRHR